MGNPSPVSALGPVILEPPAIHRVQDADRQLEFRGFLEHRVSTETIRKPQWLELELWKICDGTGRYGIHTVGKSVLYHEENSDCNTGVLTMAGRMSSDSEPCRKCRPADFRKVPKTTVFEAETDRHKFQVCDGREDPVRWPRDEFGNAAVMDPDTGPDGTIIRTAEEKAWDISAFEVVRHLRESWHRKTDAASTLSAPAQRLLDTVALFDTSIAGAMNVVERI